MKMSGNTVLITGGTSGIGLEMAVQLINLGNTVIVTGRDQVKLDEIKQKIAGIHTIKSDVSDPSAIESLHSQVTRDFPELNILINNAGIMRKINLNDQKFDLHDLTREIETNLMGPIRMTQVFLPNLKNRKSAAVVNVSSGLAFVPLPISPIYSATKSGLHAFTECLRIQLKNSKVKIFELAPPGTETPLFRGDFTKDDLGGVKSMEVHILVKQAIEGLKSDKLEIRPGLSNVLRIMSRVAPSFMLKQLGKPVDRMLDPAKA